MPRRMQPWFPFSSPKIHLEKTCEKKKPSDRTWKHFLSWSNSSSSGFILKLIGWIISIRSLSLPLSLSLSVCLSVSLSLSAAPPPRVAHCFWTHNPHAVASQVVRLKITTPGHWVTHSRRYLGGWGRRILCAPNVESIQGNTERTYLQEEEGAGEGASTVITWECFLFKTCLSFTRESSFNGCRAWVMAVPFLSANSLMKVREWVLSGSCSSSLTFVSGFSLSVTFD